MTFSPRSLSWLVPLAVLGGCAPSLSTFQPAHVAPKGHWQVGAGMELSIAPGGIADAVDVAKTVADKVEGAATSGATITQEEKLQLFDGGIRLLLNPPISLPSQHLVVAYTPVDHLEASIRYAGGAWRLGARYQLLDHNTGPFDLTVGLGVSRFTYEFPMSGVIPVLKLEDFSRWQLDVPLLIGTSRDWMRVWAGPKFMMSSFGTTMYFEIPYVSGTERDLASFDGKAYYFGGQGGIALGYKYVFFAFELTLMEVMGTAHSEVTIPGTTPFARDTSLSGFVIFPSFGLMGQF